MKMNDPGKYDDACTQARISTQGKGVALIVIRGSKGNGFSVQMPKTVLVNLPDILEFMAQEIRADIKRSFLD